MISGKRQGAARQDKDIDMGAQTLNRRHEIAARMLSPALRIEERTCFADTNFALHHGLIAYIVS